ncbi:MAG: ABC transporter permease subunit [Christensenella sp.]|uniref:ABC transporter permease n=1 Tax=Christensenella sp. TaxID=1935934 RepID=UPI002B208D58|nr:ABC transporter permease subunit [Christensenella sp.]MEA5003898.1 ABC transporter permease subunit [Christensenella sp.]
MGTKSDALKKVVKILFVDEKDENDKYRKAGFSALYRKELADQFKGKRFLIMLLLIAVIAIISVYSAGQGIQTAINEGSVSTSVFLSLFTSSGGSLPSFVSFLSFLGPIVGIILGFDAINGERSKRTLSRLVSQPIYRDSILNGKFWAGVTVIAMMIFTLGLIVAGVGIIMTGIPPTMDELLRLLVFLVFTVVYMALWLSISTLFSIVFRHAATSVLSGIAIWVFLTFFMGIIASSIANGVYPVTDQSTTSVVLSNYNLAGGVSRISPATLYSESVSTILDPSVRSIGVILTSQVDRAVTGALSIDQSILLVWPHLIGLLAITMICFAISYVVFMRQEIRAGS